MSCTADRSARSNTTERQPSTIATAMISTNPAWPAQTATASPPRAEKRPASHAIIARRRSMRSTRTPAGSWIRRYGIVAANPTIPASAGEPVRASTRSG